jgi:hypothetical protein
MGIKGMTDCVVRLGLALAVIMLITAFFYGYGSPRAVAIEPATKASVVK